METYQSTGIQLHLITGHKRMFYLEQAEQVAKICDDLAGPIFSRASLVLDCGDEIISFPASALLGITVLTHPLPEAFHEMERMSKKVITQISQESFQLRRLQNMAKIEGQKGPSLSELEFVSGERLWLKFCEIGESDMGERSGLYHLFTRHSLSCRRLDGGFCIWNTAHIVSWSHYPRVEVPINAWIVERLAQPNQSEGHPLELVL